MAPPYRIETPRLVLRCWEPRDAARLGEAVESSLESLRAWMPWASEEPQPLAARVELLRGFRGRFDLDREYVYGLFDAGGEAVVGGSGLHTRVGAGALKIGYWIRASRQGEGFATEAAGALTYIGFACCGVDRMEIHVDPANAASLKVPAKLGYTREAVLRRRLPAPEPGGAPRDMVVFTLLRDDVAGSPVAGLAPEAYDSTGARLSLPALTG